MLKTFLHTFWQVVPKFLLEEAQAQGAHHVSSESFLGKNKF